MAGDSQDRTEAASARHLQQARDQGDIPVSRELSLFAGLGGGGAALLMQLAAAGPAPLHWFKSMLQQRTVGEAALPSAITAVIWAVAPTTLGAVTAVLAAGALQTGFLMRGFN
jgi:flagellar biosynthetic protein FlhB